MGTAAQPRCRFGQDGPTRGPAKSSDGLGKFGRFVHCASCNDTSRCAGDSIGQFFDSTRIGQRRGAVHVDIGSCVRSAIAPDGSYLVTAGEEAEIWEASSGEKKAKLDIGLAKGKKQHDKRATQKDRDWKRQQARILKSSNQ